jgi:hypothetical protein
VKTKRISFTQLDEGKMRTGDLRLLVRKGEQYVNVKDLEKATLALVHTLEATQENKKILFAFTMAIMSLIKE